MLTQPRLKGYKPPGKQYEKEMFAALYTHDMTAYLVS